MIAAMAISAGHAITAHNNDLEYRRFYKGQCKSNRHAPARNQYYLAIAMTWDVNNPPPPPYFKTKLALLINAIANVLP